MMKGSIVASVEFGSATIKLLVSEFVEERQNILFIDEIRSTGIKAGLIENKQNVVRDLRKLIDQAEDFLNAKIVSLVVLLPSVSLVSKEVHYDLIISENEVKGKHIKDLFNRVYQEESHQYPDKEIAFIYPNRFTTSKSRRALYNPIGENTRDLSVDLEIYYEDKQTMIDYVSVVDQCGVTVLDIMPKVVAYKNALLTRDELNDYTCVVDIGDQTTTISVFHQQLLVKSECFKIGGEVASKAIEKAFDLRPQDAVLFKEIHGQAVSREAGDEIVFEQHFKDGSITYITSKYVAKIIDEKYLEIVRVIRQYLLEMGYKAKINQYVLIGGAVMLEQFETLFKHNFGDHVAVRRPDFIGARHPKYSTIISSHTNIFYLQRLFDNDFKMLSYNDEV